MALTVCSMCGGGFSGRSDAIYCSSACRQRAHRARAARRAAVLLEGFRRSFVPTRESAEASRTLRLSVATSLHRARLQVDRSRELCRTSERRLQESDALLRKRMPWLGN